MLRKILKEWYDHLAAELEKLGFTEPKSDLSGGTVYTYQNLPPQPYRGARLLLPTYTDTKVALGNYCHVNNLVAAMGGTPIQVQGYTVVGAWESIPSTDYPNIALYIFGRNMDKLPKFTTAFRLECEDVTWITGGGETFIINELLFELDKLRK